jgi:hypothetical protein
MGKNSGEGRIGKRVGRGGGGDIMGGGGGYYGVK